MGLLNGFPLGLLNLIQNEAHSSKTDYGPGVASNWPSWPLQLQQRPPLSLAGPDAPADIAYSPASRRSPAADPPLLAAGRPFDSRLRQLPAPTAVNLTTQVLRTKGVPESDITAAIGNPERIKSLIVQHFGAGSVRPPVLYGPVAEGQAQLYDPSQFFDGSLQESNPDLTRRSPLTQLAGFECQGFPAGCQFGGDYGTTATHFGGGRDLCRKCAIRYLGIENEPNAIQIQVLRNFEKK